MLDLKKLDATRNLLQLQTDGQQITYYFCSPLLKHLIKCNPEVVVSDRLNIFFPYFLAENSRYGDHRWKIRNCG